MYVNLEIEDMLKNEDYEAHCTNMPIEYEFE